MAPARGQAEEQEVEHEALTQVEAALENLASVSKVDDAALKSIDKAIGSLNDATKRAVIDLPAFQSLVQKAAEGQVGVGRPGETVQAGMFSYKRPYSLEDIYTIQGMYPSFVPNKDEVVGYEGFVWRLREGIIYDTPRDVPAEKLAEGHGYQVPNIVVGIINDSIAARRQIRKETEQAETFSQGVKYIGPGWAGKETVIADQKFPGDPTSEA